MTFRKEFRDRASGILPSGVKRVFRKAINRLPFRAPQRAENPFATHIPVLVGLAQLLRVERVLELGCGQYSTLTFLQPAVFSNLVKLQSIENDSAWVDKVIPLTNRDSRMNLTLVDK